MTNIINELSRITTENNKFIVKKDFIEGYNESEIKEIEERYNLSIHGELKELLMLMGKNSGGLLLGCSITIYSEYSKPTGDYFGIDMQKAWQNENDYGDFLELINYANLIEKQFLIIADDEQLYFYFMLTNNQDDLVYVYYDGDGDNPAHLKVVGTLFEFLKMARKNTYCNITGENEDDFFRLTTGKLL